MNAKIDNVIGSQKFSAASSRTSFVAPEAACESTGSPPVARVTSTATSSVFSSINCAAPRPPDCDDLLGLFKPRRRARRLLRFRTCASTWNRLIALAPMIHHIVLYKLKPEVTPARVEDDVVNHGS